MFRHIITFCFFIRFATFPFIRRVALRFSARGSIRLMTRIIFRLIHRGKFRPLYRAIVAHNASRVARIVGSVTTLSVTARFVSARTVQVTFRRCGKIVGRIRIRAVRPEPILLAKKK